MNYILITVSVVLNSDLILALLALLIEVSFHAVRWTRVREAEAASLRWWSRRYFVGVAGEGWTWID